MIEKLIPLHTHCEQHGISLRQLAILVLLEKQPSTPSKLASALSLTGAAMTGQIDALTAKGYLSTAPDPKDRRQKWASPTPAATLLLHGAHALCSQAA